MLSDEASEGGEDDGPVWLHPPTPCTPAHTVSKIEDVMLAMLGAMAADGEFPRQPRSSFATSSAEYNAATQQFEEKEVEPDEETGELRAPKNVYAGKQRRMEYLAKDMAVLSMAHRLVIDGRNMTLRELYYKKVGLFKKGQRTLNRTVLRAAHRYIGVKRSDLGIVAAAKGLVAGRLQFTFPQAGAGVGGAAAGAGAPAPAPAPVGMTSATPIPSNVAAATLISDATFCLVAEKEAVFQQLLESPIPILERCILITGKGYPDLSSRILCNKISTELKIPIAVLVDCDPHGVRIMLTYKFGSKEMAFENASLATPNMLWMGLRPSDLGVYSVAEEEKLPLSQRDKKLLEQLLYDDAVVEHSTIGAELEKMAESGIKAEIEAVKLAEFITAKVDANQWI